MEPMELATFMVSIFAMCGTVIAAIATYMNVKVAQGLLKEQKDESNRLRMPFISAMPRNFCFPTFNDFEEYYDNLIVNDEELEYINNVLLYTNKLDIKLINIHSGVAKDIKIKAYINNLSSFLREWKDDLSTNYESFRFLESTIFLKFICKDSIINERLLTKETKVDYVSILGQGNVSNDIKEDIRVQIPPAFLFLLSVFSSEYYLDRETKFPAPELKLEIECKDLLDNSHFFDIKYCFDSMEYISNITDEIIKLEPKYILNVKKIKK
ncbi:hypothetical protein ACFTQ7_12925 [Lysinibacillus sp. NPDC056959]|uniref:hypothetical protein n=1 Tax=Lysinibacillus sp. NPDC056959 TaxID=3345981 RepID=UPI0036310008